MNLNKVILIGRLTADPDLRTTTSGHSVANFSLATNRFWNNKNGERQEETEFHNIVVWGRQAEVANQFLNKGDMAMVEGRLQTRTWQGKDGQNRKTTEIIAERVQFGPKSAKNAGKNSFDQSSPEQDKKSEDQTKENDSEKIPEIDIDEGENVNPEDIPF